MCGDKIYVIPLETLRYKNLSYHTIFNGSLLLLIGLIRDYFG
jgi:hypothetical protein